MTNPAYAMARLNAKTVRFHLGTGRGDGHAPEDVAAGIAFTSAGLGRELLMLVFWPDGARLSTANLDHLLIGAQFGQWNALKDVLVNAQIREHYAVTTQEKREAKARLTSAQQAMWPAIDDTYRLMRRAVLLELHKPRNCPDCSGSGEKVVDELLQDCKRCNGTGLTKRGPVWRSEQLDMTHQSFRARWEKPYEWLLAHCKEELRAAHDSMTDALA